MKIVVGGALNKKENAELIETYGNGQVEVQIMQDIQAALALKNGQADYYFGSCQTGAGGALGMAISMNGMDKCITVFLSLLQGSRLPLPLVQIRTLFFHRVLPVKFLHHSVPFQP